ncbi:MAG: ATP-binding protein [Acidobacteriota bacterium]
MREPHASVARNARICEALFLARYIEKFGTGTLMMIRQCTERGLPEPDFDQRGGGLVVTLWRDWLTEAVVERLGLNDRQRRAVALLKQRRRLDNKAYQEAFGVSKPTATRDLDELVSKRVLLKVGRTGRGTFYVIPRKGLKGLTGLTCTHACTNQPWPGVASASPMIARQCSSPTRPAHPS